MSFPYPAPVALVLAPFGLLSSFAESIPITAAGIMAAPLALWILKVRDWRVYGAVALWAPVVVAWQTANFTLLLVVGAALVWRFPERSAVTAVLVACLVSIKPILAPLWIWLLLTRRWRAAMLAVVIGVTVNAAAWTALGWHELAGWLNLLSLQGKLQDGIGYSLIALATHLALPKVVGVMVMAAFGCALVTIAVMASRTQRDLTVYGAMVLLAIVISPQADSHYFAFLLVPMAVRRPGLSWRWIVPLVLWVCPATRAHGWQILVWWSVVAVLARDFLGDWGLPATTTRVRSDPSDGMGPAASLARPAGGT